jgi:GT2 family glycosyltransferase
LLNPDAYLADDALKNLLEAIERCPRAGAAAPQLQDMSHIPQVVGRRFPSGTVALLTGTRLTHLLPRSRRIAFVQGPLLPLDGEPLTVDWLSGACLLIRRETWDTVGSLDEAFFLYGEDLDWCWRARRAGWTSLYVPEAIAYHVGGASARRLHTNREIELRIWTAVELAARRNLPVRQYWFWRASQPVARFFGRLLHPNLS